MMPLRRRFSAPTRRFSSTVRLGNTDEYWKVRASPRRARASLVARVTSVEPRRTVPRSGSSVPDRQWKSVVLPAPFGPMMAVTWPGSTSRSTPSTAWTPA
jgi:hypothetical protein